MNNWQGTGRLVRNPQISYTQSGKARAVFVVASHKAKPKDGGEDADFIPCVAWDRLAELVRDYLHKGSLVTLAGPIRTSKYGWEVVAIDIDFMEKPLEKNVTP